MRNIDTVLAATDFSPCSRLALDAAAHVAELHEARLVVAHVLRNLDQSYSLVVDDLLEAERLEAEESLDQTLDALRISRSRLASVVTEGSPVDALIRTGLSEHADLLVAGVLGDSCGSQASLLGSVVDRLMRSGLFDLLLVREDETPGFQKVAVATDFSQSADVALERAVDLARRSGLDSVLVVHAFDLPRGYSKIGLGPEDAERKVRANVGELFDALRERLPEPDGIRYEAEVVRGVDHDAIREACRRHDVDLLVVGALGRTAAAAALIGNVALKIVRDAPCSVWVSRPAGHTLTFADAVRRLMGMG